MGNAVMTISGYLGNGPETKQLQSGVAWTEFVVGMKSGYGDKEETNWIRCKVFGRTGESCLNNLLKGDYVTCSGDFEIRHFRKQDGTDGVAYELKVSSVVFGPKMPGRPLANGAYGRAPAQQGQPYQNTQPYRGQEYQQPAYVPPPTQQPTFVGPPVQQLLTSAPSPAYAPQPPQPPAQAVPPASGEASAPKADESDLPF